MFGFFKKNYKLNITSEEKTWVDESFSWLVDRVGRAKTKKPLKILELY